MFESEKIIEKPKQSLSFIEQLQSQIQLCREGMSNPDIPLASKIDTLEALLWAKLKDDKEYCDSKKKLFESYNRIIEDIEKNENLNYHAQSLMIRNSKRSRSKEQFKLIMIFIDKMNFMPIGLENE